MAATRKKQDSTTAVRRPHADPVRRQTVAMLTLEAIREQILRGTFPEGASLRQDALATDLGVSRIPVREALRQLEAEGLVTFSPHVGAVVSSLSLGEIKELFELRALIEADMLHRAVPAITPEELTAAEEILDRYETALQTRDMAAWGALNWQFHATLYSPANQPLTMGVVQTLHNQSDRYLRMQLALTQGETRAREEHRAILRAAREGEAGLADSLLTAHILGAGRSLLEFLRQQRENDTPFTDQAHPG